ncbi:hypothetical protein RRG08_032790 [Elysia crispata]|uniref:Uncharacterized protein n=1 Tax=Elysia crispata TaxID=231223 RepID=A0AAE0YNG4_9GAST|nr:hypothetical protein RRG08_032790 [Elysia crispata]
MRVCGKGTAFVLEVITVRFESMDMDIRRNGLKQIDEDRHKTNGENQRFLDLSLTQATIEGTVQYCETFFPYSSEITSLHNKPHEMRRFLTFHITFEGAVDQVIHWPPESRDLIQEQWIRSYIGHLSHETWSRSSGSGAVDQVIHWPPESRDLIQEQWIRSYIGHLSHETWSRNSGSGHTLAT